jgi:hypothetical protein
MRRRIDAVTKGPDFPALSFWHNWQEQSRLMRSGLKTFKTFST